MELLSDYVRKSEEELDKCANYTSSKIATQQLLERATVYALLAIAVKDNQ